MRMRLLSRERGVAVVTALLLTTLAITIVASLFWQQQVQVRSIENQRLQLQKQWILRGAIDYARLILMADRTPDSDGLDEPWAVPLAETRLDDYVENGRSGSDVPDAVLSGGIEDAQSRFNLRDICCIGNQPNPKKLAAFGRLLTVLQLNSSLAQATANYLLASRTVNSAAAGATGTGSGTSTTTGAGTTGAGGTAGGGGSVPQTAQAQALNLLHVDDLLAVPGFTPEILEKLRPYVIVIDDSLASTVNINTASAEVLHAAVENLSISAARAIVMARRNASFKDLSDRTLASLTGPGVNFTGVAGVKTNYFLINGKVRLNRAGMQMQTLIKRELNRNQQGRSQVIWIREF